jgi:hypothetical protein
MNKNLKFICALIAIIILIGFISQFRLFRLTHTPSNLLLNKNYLKNNSTTILEEMGQNIFTEKDFSGFGLEAAALRNQKESSFKAKINQALPAFVFHVVSFTSSTPGYIEIFEQNQPHAIQKINLNSDMFNAENVPLFFNLADINFDGYADIGVPKEGGALWVSYQYWVFDKQKGIFVNAPISDDFGKIRFGLSIKFDNTQKQIITTGVDGAVLSYKNMYQYSHGRLVPLEKIEQENIVVEDEKANTETPNLKCKITTKKYTNQKESIFISFSSNACAVFD